MTVDMEPGEVVEQLKQSLRRMPGAVTLITTKDPDTGAPGGLVASAVIPASMEPPSMIIAINRNASAHVTIEKAGRFCINLLSTDQTELVALFSDSAKREERFTGTDWNEAYGLPHFPAACANLFCSTETSMIYGTHQIFIGKVDAVIGSSPESAPLAWMNGAFARIDQLIDQT